MRQGTGNLQEVPLVLDVEGNCDAARLGLRRCGLACSVDGLGNLRPDGEVSPDDDVVNQRRGRTVLVNA